MLPADHHKVLANIRKVEARTKRRKQLVKEDEDESDSEEETSKPKGQRYKKSPVLTLNTEYMRRQFCVTSNLTERSVSVQH